MPLKTRSIPRQLAYLFLAMLGLLACLSLLAAWGL
jgi:hypothetical protein